MKNLPKFTKFKPTHKSPTPQGYPFSFNSQEIDASQITLSPIDTSKITSFTYEPFLSDLLSAHDIKIEESSLGGTVIHASPFYKNSQLEPHHSIFTHILLPSSPSKLPKIAISLYTSQSTFRIINNKITNAFEYNPTTNTEQSILLDPLPFNHFYINHITLEEAIGLSILLRSPEHYTSLLNDIKTTINHTQDPYTFSITFEEMQESYYSALESLSNRNSIDTEQNT